MKRKIEITALVLFTAVNLFGQKREVEAPIINKYGQTGLWRTQSAETGGETRLTASLGFDYAERSGYLKSVEGFDGEEGCKDCDPEYSKAEWNLGISYGISDIWDVSVMLPVYNDWISTTQYCDSSEGFIWPLDGDRYAAGDLELGTTVNILGKKLPELLSLGYYGAFSFPTGSDKQGYFPAKFYYQSYDGSVENHYGSGVVEMENLILATLDFQTKRENLPLKAHFNAGIRIPFDADKFDQISLLNAGVSYRPLNWLDIFAEYSMESRTKSWTKGYKLNRDPMTITPGIVLRTPHGVSGMIGTDISLSADGGYRYQNEDVIIETEPQPKMSLVAAVNWSMVLKRDSDGDGYYDREDKCPHNPEDFDSFMDEDGCPELDNDDDGFLDSDDSCPNVKESINAYHDFDGCPDFNPHTYAEEGKGTVLYDITFAFDKDVLESQSFIVLDSIAASMEEWPSITIHVAGFTDSVGNAEYNKKLSLRRAESVKKYLVAEGIDSSRITTEGRGEDSDLSSNMSKDGRSANRHVEILRTDAKPNKDGVIPYPKRREIGAENAEEKTEKIDNELSPE